MKLLPYQKITISTKLTKEEALQKIRENTTKPDWLNPQGNTLFLGVVTHKNFKVKRNLNYKGTIVPFMTGSFLLHTENTTLEIILKPHVATLTIVSIWLGAVSLISIWIIVTTLTSKEAFSILALIPLGMLVSGVAVLSGGFGHEYQKSKEALLELLNAKEAETL